MKALLIVDMQLGSFKPYSSRFDTEGVIGRINKLAEKFRANRQLVVFITHDGSRENTFLPGTNDWEILPEIGRSPLDIYVSKIANDAFYESELDAVLRANEVIDLYITGCATDFCVDSTVKSAHSREYRVTVIEDGHTTASRPNLEAEQVIKYFNWIWLDMIPTKHKIKIIRAADLKL